jgi:mono/diheme cytochrome c family protein
VRKPLKYLGAGLAASIGLATGAFTLAVWLGELKAQRFVEVRVVPVPYVRDAAALRTGKALYESRCAACHGADGRGRVVIDEPGGPYVRAPNITPHPSSSVARYGEADWVRAVRHGVDRAGRPLLEMPSEIYSRMNDADFAALVAYTRSLQPAEGETGLVRLPPVRKALYGIGAISDSAGTIDHRRPTAARRLAP